MNGEKKMDLSNSGDNYFDQEMVRGSFEYYSYISLWRIQWHI